MSLSFEEDWAVLRRARPKQKRLYTDITDAQFVSLVSWAARSSDPNNTEFFRTLPGDDRAQLIERFEQEMPRDTFFRVAPRNIPNVLPNFLRDSIIHPALRGRHRYSFPLPHPLRNPHPWDILWGVAASQEWHLDDPLRGMTDRRVGRCAEVFRVLNEVRFECREQKNWNRLLEVIPVVGQWLSGDDPHPFLSRALVTQPFAQRELLDANLYLWALAKQNDLTGHVFLIVEDLQEVTFEEAICLNQLIEAVTRWGILGSPVRLLFSWDARDKKSLRNLHSGLSKSVRAGMAWI